MNELIRIATPELARFLNAKLPALSADWWPKHVVQRLSFQQQRTVQERGHKTLEQLDFAALLRVLDQNWYELSNVINLPREGRTWVKELQTIRNKWAHQSAEAMAPSEVYRDADTLGRFLVMIEAPPVSLDAVEATKAAAVSAMANLKRGAAEAPQKPANELAQSNVSDNTVSCPIYVPLAPTSLFHVGDLVALRSNSATILPVIEVMPGGGECRYRVFQDNGKATYYESQLQSPASAADKRTMLSALELQARLTSLQTLSPSTAHLFSLRSGRVQFVPY
ncbi:MAG TPA: Swt1 family HEPN domain-containing protein [Tepidisphaeraceae bacterium]|jgi:hypothetical protein